MCGAFMLVHIKAILLDYLLVALTQPWWSQLMQTLLMAWCGITQQVLHGLLLLLTLRLTELPMPTPLIWTKFTSTTNMIIFCSLVTLITRLLPTWTKLFQVLIATRPRLDQPAAFTTMSAQPLHPKSQAFPSHSIQWTTSLSPFKMKLWIPLTQLLVKLKSESQLKMAR